MIFCFTFRLLMTLVTNIHTLMHIHDLTNSPLAVIPLGEAKVQVGFVRIIHPIELNYIQDVIIKINKDVQETTHCNALQELIKIKNRKLYETFLKIKPFIRSRRVKRWDAIGTTWKWIAGSPDAEDLRIINSSINSLITGNNRQIMINQAINNQIQGITDVTNELLIAQQERMKNHSIEINQLIILSNLDLLQNQMDTLEESILMAKHGIPSSKLLSIHSFNRIATLLQEHEIYLSSFEELLTQSTAQVILNTTHIAYILKIPQLSKEVYEYNYIDSTIKNGKRIILEHNFILKNITHVFELTDPCERQNNYHLCSTSSLTYTSECVQSLIQGQHSNCSFEKVYTKGLVKRINDETIFINDAIADISSNCSNSNQILNGTYLIQFEQCSLIINGELYSNYEYTLKSRPYLPTTGQLVQEINIIDAPPPEYIRNLTLEHRQRLDQIHLESHSLSWKFNVFGSIGLSTIIIVIMTIGLLFYFSRFSFTKINLELPKQEKEDIQLSELRATAPGELSDDPLGELSDERKKEIDNFVNSPSPYRTLTMTLNQLCGQS